MSGLVHRYQAERLPIPMLAIVPVLLAVSGQAGGSTGPASFLTDLALAGLLFVQCRILDDIVDRHRDRDLHPERVLVRAATVWPVAAAGVVLAAVTVAVLLLRQRSGGPIVSAAISQSLGGYVAVVAILAAVYAGRRRRSLLGDHLILAKYPAFVWIIATSRLRTIPLPGPAAAQLALSMIAAYLAACIYEALHDAGSPAAARPALVAAEGMLLALTLAVLLMPLSLQRHL